MQVERQDIRRGENTSPLAKGFEAKWPCMVREIAGGCTET